MGLTHRFECLEKIYPDLTKWVAPKLLPDEFITGWLNRFAQANCYDKPEDFVKTVMRFSKASRNPNDDTAYVSSIVTEYANITVSDLERLHTLRPWTQLCRTFSSKTSTETKLHPAAQNRAYVRSRLNRSGMCKECIREDRSFWGWTYWRRNHQIPAVTICLKHRAGLYFTPAKCFTSHSPLSACPSGILSPDASSFGERYSEIAVGLVEEATSQMQRQLPSRLQEIAQFRTGETKPVAIRKYLCAAGVEQITDTWMAQSQLGTTTTKSLILSICDRFPKWLSASHVAIVLTLLCDDADQALQLLTTQSSTLAKTSNSSATTG